MADQRRDVALHIFGVAPGTCPPGTSLGLPHAPAPVQDTWWTEQGGDNGSSTAISLNPAGEERDGPVGEVQLTSPATWQTD